MSNITFVDLGYSQERLGDKIKSDIVLNVCEKIIGNNPGLSQGSKERPFLILNVDLNFRDITIGNGLYSERYGYSMEKFDSSILNKIEKTFHLDRQFNFILKNDSHDFEYLRSTLVSNDSVLALNGFKGYSYFKIGKPIESWDILYLIDDSTTYFKYFKRKKGHNSLFSVSIPVIEFKYLDGSGVEKKFIFQYIIAVNNKGYTIKLTRKINL